MTGERTSREVGGFRVRLPWRQVSARSALNAVPLGAVLLLSAVLRAWGIGHRALESDEIRNLEVATSATRLADVMTAGWQHTGERPGYRVLLRAMVGTFGDSPAAMRLPSMVSGVGSVLLVYLVGRRLYSRREGLAAAALMAVLWHPIRDSQSATVHAPLTLAALSSVYFLLGILDGRPTSEGKARWGGVVAYAVSALGCAFLHFYGALLMFVGAGFVVGASLRRGPVRARALPMYALVFLTYGAVRSRALLDVKWLAWKPPRFTMSAAEGTISKDSPPASLHWDECAGYFFNRSTTLAVVALTLVVLSVLARSDTVSSRRRTGALLLAWAVAPWALAVTLDQPLVPRDLVVGLPPLCLFVGRAFALLPLSSGGRLLASPLAVALLALHLVSGMRYYAVTQDASVEQVVRHVVQAEASRGDAIVIAAGDTSADLNLYFERLGSARRVDLGGFGGPSVRDVLQVMGRRRTKYIWFIYRGDLDAMASKGHDGVLRFLMRQATIVEEGTSGDAGYILLQTGAAENPLLNKDPIKVDISVVPTDAHDLECATDERVAGLRCAYTEGLRKALDGSSADDTRLLRPYTTRAGFRLLAAGMWSDPELRVKMSQGSDPEKPFVVHCLYDLLGTVRKLKVRWKGEGTPWQDVSDWRAGVVSGCELAEKSQNDRPVQNAERRLRAGAKEVELGIHLLPTDNLDLSCASRDEIKGLHCELDADLKPWRGAVSASDRALLRPYSTTDGFRLLAAGVWSEPEIVKAAATKRGHFVANCVFKSAGTMAEYRVRWKRTEAWGVERGWYVGAVSGCSVP